MPQENGKSNDDVATIPRDDTEEESTDRSSPGNQKVDVTKKKNLESDMPELENDQELRADERISLDLSEPPPEIAEYARREIGETEEVKCQTLQEFRDMIYEKGECLPHRMDDDFLIRFLRARNFNLKSAHRLIVRYCDFKEEHPELYQQLNVTQMRYIGDDDVMTVPPYRSQCGRRIIIYRLGNWDPHKYALGELFKATVSILELGLLEPAGQILGGIVIFDLKDITMSQARNVTPHVANIMLSIMVTSFPVKVHAIHILHQSWVFDTIFTVFKSLIDANMRNRIFFHGNDFASLHKHMSPDYLPKKYGGVRNELPYYKWLAAIIQDSKVIAEMNKMGYVVTDEMIDSFSKM